MLFETKRFFHLIYRGYRANSCNEVYSSTWCVVNCSSDTQCRGRNAPWARRRENCDKCKPSTAAAAAADAHQNDDLKNGDSYEIKLLEINLDGGLAIRGGIGKSQQGCFGKCVNSTALCSWCPLASSSAISHKLIDFICIWSSNKIQ